MENNKFFFRKLIYFCFGTFKIFWPTSIKYKLTYFTPGPDLPYNACSRLDNNLAVPFLDDLKIFEVLIQALSCGTKNKINCDF